MTPSIDHVRATWEKALAHYHAARASWDVALDAYSIAEQARLDNPCPETEAAEDLAEAEQSRLSTLDSEAMIDLMKTPAPDVDAILLKLQFISEWGLTGMPTIRDVVEEFRVMTRREVAHG